MREIIEPQRALPVVAEVDVVVCGGGPAGIAAALAAARNGARTVLVEKYGFLGGQGTAGLICYFAPGGHDGERPIIGGIWEELSGALQDSGALYRTLQWEPYDPEAYKTLTVNRLLEAGVEVRLHTTVAWALVEGGQIQAVVVESKSGRQALVASVYVDATGDGDLAAYCGAQYELGRPGDGLMMPPTLMYVIGGVDTEQVHLQASKYVKTTVDGHSFVSVGGLSKQVQVALEAGEVTIPRDHVSAVFELPWKPGVFGVNYGRLLGVNSCNAQDLTRAEVEGRRQVDEGMAFLRKYVPGFANIHLLYTAPQIGIREGRRIRGHYWMTEADIDQGRQFDDVVAQGCYGVDIHAPDQITTVLTKLERGTHYDIPFRALVPHRISNLLLAGRDISASHEAMSAFRVQPICMGIGQAAGTAAALCSQRRCSPSELPVEVLQQRLVADGVQLS